MSASLINMIVKCMLFVAIQLVHLFVYVNRDFMNATVAVMILMNVSGTIRTIVPKVTG